MDDLYLLQGFHQLTLTQLMSIFVLYAVLLVAAVLAFIAELVAAVS